MDFLRLAHAKTMDKPKDYNKETMEALAKRYKESAQATNEARANNLTDSTVVMILSESFSDPTRAPGVELTEALSGACPAPENALYVQPNME